MLNVAWLACFDGALSGSASASGQILLARGTARFDGILLALVSGALTSGLGYAVWYRALPGLSVTQAAVAQLAVPILAALAAAVLLGEALTARLVIAGALVLSGVGIVLSARARAQGRG